MKIDIAGLHEGFDRARRGKSSRHSPADRVTPSLFQFDYLALSRLGADIRELIAELPSQTGGRVALDLGADKCPYRGVLEAGGFSVKTLDVAPGGDYVGSAERTGLPDSSFDLVLCTQVLEHCDDPWAATREIRRILKPGGHLIATVPHVWFYHPHPSDHWRFTQEGVVKLCSNADLVTRTLLAQGGSVLTLGQVVNFLAYGVLGRWGGPLFALVNLLAGAADELVRNELLCLNFAVLAQRER
jgi:SAM-dependent methyltransferase